VIFNNLINWIIRTKRCDHQLILNSINQSDVALLYSNNQGFDIAIVEGMACGKSLIPSGIIEFETLLKTTDYYSKKEVKLNYLI
jgi:hypothetical protein